MMWKYGNIYKYKVDKGTLWRVVGKKDRNGGGEWWGNEGIFWVGARFNYQGTICRWSKPFHIMDEINETAALYYPPISILLFYSAI